MNVVQGLLSAVSPLPDGDRADRLSYCISTVGLVVASAFVSGWSFVGSPIQCWFPAYYKGWWMEYALDFCYVQNTYFVPFSDQKIKNAFDFGAHMVQIPQNITEREEKQIGYYQWVPFILALQAILFYLPILLWRAIYESAGFKIRAICETCSISSNMDEEERKRNMSIVAGFLSNENALSLSLRRKSTNVSSGGGSFIVTAYILTKVLFALNAVVQFWLLQLFLGVDSMAWGWNVTMDLLGGREWPESGNFPRVTMCDFSVRVLGNLHHHSVQCVLMINMFNEKIFVLLWFWLCFMAAVSVSSLMYWLATSMTASYGRGLINSYIYKLDPSVDRSTQKKSLLQEFVSEKLRVDGVFLIRLIAANSGDSVAATLLKTLWDAFVDERGQRPPPYHEPLLLSKKKIDEDDL